MKALILDPDLQGNVTEENPYAALRFGDMEEQDALAPDEVRCECLDVSICGSDVHAGKFNKAFTAKFRRTAGPDSPFVPLVLGHEGRLRVLEVGSAVTKFKKGDIVVAIAAKGCGKCDEFCLQGHTEVCESRELLGISEDGLFRERYVGRECHFVRVADSLKDSPLAAISEPVAVLVHSIRQLQDRGGKLFNKTAFVSGTGPIGIIEAILLRDAGVEKLAVSGIEADKAVRLKFLQDAGFETICVGRDQAEREAQIKAIFGGKGPQIWFETSGDSSAIGDAYNLTRPNGHCVFVGHNAGWPENACHTTGIRFQATPVYTYGGNVEDFRTAVIKIEKYRGLFEEMVRCYPFDKVVDGFNDAEKLNVIKATIQIAA